MQISLFIAVFAMTASTPCGKTETVWHNGYKSTQCISNDSISIYNWSDKPEYPELKAHFFPISSAVVFIVVTFDLFKLTLVPLNDYLLTTVIVIQQPIQQSPYGTPQGVDLIYENPLQMYPSVPVPQQQQQLKGHSQNVSGSVSVNMIAVYAVCLFAIRLRACTPVLVDMLFHTCLEHTCGVHKCSMLACLYVQVLK